MLAGGENVWVAREEEVAPHLVVKYVADRFDRASLSKAITARIGETAIPIGPLELRIAYKPYPGTETDFEDAVHRNTLLEESPSTRELEAWVAEPGVETDYDRPTGA